MGRFDTEKRGDMWHVVDTTTGEVVLFSTTKGYADMEAEHLNDAYEYPLMEVAG
tara:strand:+ start:336 stop:497 length:162 start_codon:yes stop_codon:yes gene_type:complete